MVMNIIYPNDTSITYFVHIDAADDCFKSTINSSLIICYMGPKMWDLHAIGYPGVWPIGHNYSYTAFH